MIYWLAGLLVLSFVLRQIVKWMKEKKMNHEERIRKTWTDY